MACPAPTCRRGRPTRATSCTSTASSSKRSHDRLRFDGRNRLEIRWLEGRSGTNERSRHRARGRYLTPDRGRLTAVFANNEFFYDWDESKYTENRLTPVGLTFRLYGEVGVDVYYMQSLETSGRWTHTHLLGTHLALAW